MMKFSQWILFLSIAACWLATAPRHSTGYDLEDPTEPWQYAASGKGSVVPAPFEPLTTDGA